MSPHISQDKLAHELTRRYIEGDETVDSLMPSARVLAEEYGVSRLFLREVLAGLQRQGLIESIPGRGVFVRKPHMLDAARNVHTTLRQSAATGHNLIEARANLEQETARLAALRATDDDIVQLEVALLAFDNASELLARAEADIAFHEALLAATQNELMKRIGKLFIPLLKIRDDMVRQVVEDADFIVQHQAVLDAVIDEDPDGAEIAMKALLETAAQASQSARKHKSR
jgi:DNA-binding FadR family transcriptional regulator